MKYIHGGFHKLIVCTSLIIGILNSCKKDETYGLPISRPPLPIDTTVVSMNIYFGNLHAHTMYSDGSGSPADGYKWARNMAKMDFYAITDHAELLNTFKWDDIGHQALKFTQKGEFVALRGFEWTSSFIGHANVFNTKYYASSFGTRTLKMLCEWLQKNHGYAQFNHPGYHGKSFNNIEYWGEGEKVFMAIETGNDIDGNNSGLYLDYYGTALDNGWKVGPTNVLDNHSLVDYGHRTAILAEELSSASILEAFAARRFYSTDDPDIKIKFCYKDNWMGSTVKYTGQVTFNINVIDNEPISKIELITNYGEIADLISFNDYIFSFSWNPEFRIIGKSYFYVKITSQNLNESDLPEQIAVTAPIWFN